MRIVRVVGIEIRHRSHREHFARTHVHDDGTGGKSAIAFHRPHDFVAHDVLDAQVDG